MKTPTVAEYVLTRLAQLGIDKVFGIPGQLGQELILDFCLKRLRGPQGI
jgi:TPP-dependent 2-oxoacid decarboxylase